MGGHQGRLSTLTLNVGDVAILPAGTGHQKVFARGHYNLCRGDNPAERDKALRTIPRVPLPPSDPVLGTSGGLTDLWTR